MSKTQINVVNKHDRTVVLVDMDCFYCQVEEKLDPSLKGKPIAVVQYNAWRGGGIIAVNYAARDRGVTRHMRGEEAKNHCPEIELVKVPSVREKADLTKYREAGKDVASVLQRFTTLLERASVDEAYLDITENVRKRFKEMNDGTFVLTPDKLTNCFAVGYDHIGDFVQNLSKKVTFKKGADKVNVEGGGDEQEKLFTKYDIKLLIGASIVNEIREAVKKETGFECSAGIAHNKILAKLVCGMNKPNKQTVLPVKNVSLLFSDLPLQKIKGLGGKFGEDVCDKLKIKLMSELSSFSLTELQRTFDDKTGLWLFQMAQGIDLEAVTPRFASKSIGCCKKFPGRNSIKGIATLTHWLNELATEIVERLDKDEIENSRVAKQIVVSFTQKFSTEEVASTRCVPLNDIDVEKIAHDALDVIKKNTDVFFKNEQNTVILNPITLLGISAGKFEDINQQKRNTIRDLFSKAITNESTKKTEIDSSEPVNGPEARKAADSKPSSIKSFFTAAKDVAEENNQKNEVDPSIDNEFDCNSNSSVDMLITNAAADLKTIHEGDTITVAADSPPVQDITATEVNDTMSTFDSNERNERTASSSVAFPENVESQQPGPSGQSDYKSSYVEYLRPDIPDEFFETCSQCHKKLLTVEMQSHLDMHLAFQLSEEQRIEFRSQLKTKTSSASPPIAKKAKLDRNANLNSSSSGGSKVSRTTDATGANGKGVLTKYFVAKKDEAPESSVQCDECGKFIPIEGVVEHSDYHTAKKLQMEINSLNVAPLVGSAVGQNPKTKSRTDPSTAKKRSIASFFKAAN
ncbi:DNA polymerase eta-like isoform X2 [Bradysia coprophila]|uniref:DNA polymerase eta-like isoform X2 n=1 Tax=Bradysia coprophila TaxID=38358 RepID=UPI00187D9A5C|nr:DNA polymerase eta-like isoform X2 [Bradysia coprophila]